MSLGQPKIIKPSRKFAQKAINIAFSQLRMIPLLQHISLIQNSYLLYEVCSNGVKNI